MQDDEQRDREDSEQGGPSPQGFVRSALVFYGILGCVGLFWRMSTPGESILHPSGAAAPAMGLGLATVLGASLGLLAVGFSELMTRFTSLGEALADVLGEGLAGIGRADGILLAFASGIAEEMFFRGALQPAVGLFWASVAFGACHFLPRRELALWAVFAVAMGFALGWLFEWTGQLVAPIAAHVVINAINLPRLAQRGAARSPRAADESDPPLP